MFLIFKFFTKTYKSPSKYSPLELIHFCHRCFHCSKTFFAVIFRKAENSFFDICRGLFDKHNQKLKKYICKVLVCIVSIIPDKQIINLQRTKRCKNSRMLNSCLSISVSMYKNVLANNNCGIIINIWNSVPKKK